MSEHYNQNHAREEISVVLQKIQECVSSGKYLIARNENRVENVAFIREYQLTSKKQQRLLMEIEVDDFCHSLQNINIGYEHEILYVFCPQVTLFNLDDEEIQLDMYTKFNILELSADRKVVVVSFHERNKSIDYLFR